MSASRPPRSTSLVLAGGNALGAYAAGAHEALHEAGVVLDLVCGASIGAIQAAIIAGNRPGDRCARLRAFWDLASAGGAWWPAPAGTAARHAWNMAFALQTLVGGRPGLFAPRASGRWSLLPGTPPDVGLFDAAPLVATLERLVDFDRLNGGDLPIVVGSVDLERGESVYFDSRRERIRPEHLLASAAFIPGFPPVEIGGRLLGDPGMLCNLPLEPVLGHALDADQRCFVVDLFDLAGPPPRSMDRALERAQDIAFAAQSARTIEAFGREHVLRHRLASLAPPAAGDDGAAAAGRFAVELVWIAYQPLPHETGAKTLDFSSASVADRWAVGKDDMTAALRRLEAARPSRREPGFDLYDLRRRAAVEKASPAAIHAT